MQEVDSENPNFTRKKNETQSSLKLFYRKYGIYDEERWCQEKSVHTKTAVHWYEAITVHATAELHERRQAVTLHAEAELHGE